MNEILKEYDVKMQKTVDVVVSDFAGVRAGRANAAVLDKITVDYSGAPTPLNHVAAISSPDPRSLMIQPWDGTLLKAIEKAIQASDLGINPQNDGRVIRQNLTACGRNEAWLLKYLSQEKISSPKEVFPLTLDEQGKVFCVRKEAAT